MPTVDRFDGLRVVIYPNDHAPEHVHVIGRGCEAVFNLQCPFGPPVLREVYGFGRQEVGHVRQILATRLASLCDRWREIHGER